MRTAALILAGGRGARLGALTRDRPKPALPFGARHRLIDYTLANCALSGLTGVGIATQYECEGIHSHLIGLSAWLAAHDIDLTLLPSAGHGVPYRGTADAVRKNQPFIERSRARTLVVLAGDHVYRADYQALLETHERSGAHVTVGAIPVDRNESHRFGMLRANAAGRIVAFEEKPRETMSDLASMGIYAFDVPALRALLRPRYPGASMDDFGHDVLPTAIARGARVQSHVFNCYWRDVGTVESYWHASMDFLNTHLRKTLEAGMPMSGLGMVPGGAQGHIEHSVVAGRVAVEAEVEDSVVSMRASVGPGAVVRDSVLLGGARIGAGAVVDHVIVDEGVRVEAGRRIVSGGASIAVLSREARTLEHAPVRGRSTAAVG